MYVAFLNQTKKLGNRLEQTGQPLNQQFNQIELTQLVQVYSLECHRHISSAEAILICKTDSAPEPAVPLWLASGSSHPPSPLSASQPWSASRCSLQPAAPSSPSWLWLHRIETPGCGCWLLLPATCVVVSHLHGVSRTSTVCVHNICRRGIATLSCRLTHAFWAVNYV